MKKVLVVDDTPEVLECLVMILKRAGYEVLTATNGSDALGVLKENMNDISLLVTDKDMPKLNGIELIEWVRNVLPSLAIVLASGDMTNKEQDAAFQAGADEVLEKPFLQDALLEAIKKAEAKHQQVAA